VESVSDDDRSGTVKKLIAAGAILGGGIAANRALSTREELPSPPPHAQPQLIPTMPVHEGDRPTEWLANAELREQGRRR
jgi:hypothetical protein